MRVKIVFSYNYQYQEPDQAINFDCVITFDRVITFDCVTTIRNAIPFFVGTRQVYIVPTEKKT